NRTLEFPSFSTHRCQYPSIQDGSYGRIPSFLRLRNIQYITGRSTWSREQHYPQLYGVISVEVGNIPYQTSENDLGNFFSQAGHVTNVRLVIDRETGRPKGFGFCEFADEQSAQNAISQFNGSDFNGRSL
ncbi:hypothetical protein PRIPAC_86494, partial [Pristionchus pacificus]